MAAIQRRLQAFYDQQEEDLHEIVAAFIAGRLIRCSVGCFGSGTEASPLPMLSHLGTTWNGKEIFV